MVEIVKSYRQSMPAMRFVGKRYTDADRVDGHFGALWHEWISKEWFDVIAKKVVKKAGWEDEESPVGLMCGNGGMFEYRIGRFVPPGTEVPAGFTSLDFPERELGVCWLYGNERELFMREEECAKRLVGEGHKLAGDYCFERYGHPRFVVPDEKGNVILDICFFLE
ncbi:MAG: GyrI-like domain-containing protein [Treponema sp.]|nr:GyrI-like domain-containing protein [Treponema sp.]